MRVEYLRMAAVTTDGDVFRILLEDNADMCGVAATRELRQCAGVAPRARAVIFIHPCGTILQPEIERT